MSSHLVDDNGYVDAPARAVTAEAEAHDGSREVQRLWGGLALLAVAGLGTRALALGLNAQVFAEVARWFGGDAESLGWAADHRAMSKITTPSALRPLPFEDAAFDTVFVCGMLEWGGGEIRERRREINWQEHLLQECQRVLKPGGVLLAIMENRFSITNWGGKRHPTTGIRFFELLPRAIESALSGELRERARLYRADSYYGWARSLRRAGLKAERWQTLWPSAGQWNQVAPLATLPSRALSGPGASLKERLAEWSLRGLQVLRVHRLVAPNFMVSARSIGGLPGARIRPSLLQEILAAEGESADAKVVVSSFANSETLSFTAGATFFKVPTTADSLLGLEAGGTVTKALTGHPVARYVPLPARIGEVRGVRYFACPAILPGPGRQVTERELGEILDALAHDATPTRISETDFWKRLFRPDLRRGVENLGGGTVLRYVERALANRSVLAGIIHGDLHLKNLLASKDRVFIIDWDRIEANSPHFLDVMELMQSAMSARGQFGLREAIPTALEMMMSADSRAPMLHRLWTQDDELSLSEMVTCYVLHLVNGRVRQCRSELPASDRSAYRSWLAFCERALERDEADTSGSLCGP